MEFGDALGGAVAEDGRVRGLAEAVGNIASLLQVVDVGEGIETAGVRVRPQLLPLLRPVTPVAR
jgi:hypothetical protein